MPRQSQAAIAERETLAAQQTLVRRAKVIAEARDDLIEFTRLTMPDPKDPSDVLKSRYDPQPFHRALARALEDVESGKYQKLIITFPPRHGKSELSTRHLPAWFMGRDPYRCVMVGSYNQPFAEDFGRAVRKVMQSPAFGQVFPDCVLEAGSQASDRMMTEQGGMLAFVGRGGSITGRGADLFIIDDPLKGRKEADSQGIRDDLWKWYLDDVDSRMMTDEAAMIIIATRWHEDDLIGRLTDSSNPYFVEEEAKDWKIFHISALARMYGAPEDDPLGRAPGEALWPQRFGKQWLEKKRAKNPSGFAALYQGVPTAEDGELFTRAMIVPYNASELPKDLRFYGASDHAVTKKQENDATCMGTVGVDANDDIWVLPDLWWDRQLTDVVVEAMLNIQRARSPLVWWAGKDHITKSIGPFLRKRMLDERVYINLQELTESQDAVTRAQPIIGRMAMRKVRLPKFAPWYENAVAELMKFPHGRNDDFVAFLSNIGRGLDRMLGADGGRPAKKAPETGTMGWVKEASRAAERERKQAERMSF